MAMMPESVISMDLRSKGYLDKNTRYGKLSRTNDINETKHDTSSSSMQTDLKELGCEQ